MKAQKLQIFYQLSNFGPIPFLINQSLAKATCRLKRINLVFNDFISTPGQKTNRLH